MRLTQNLLGWLNRVFNKDPKQTLALRLDYAGTSMTWQVQDGFLTTTVNGGVGVNLNIDLSQYTLASLTGYIAGQSGYTVVYLNGNMAALSALVLLDASGNPALSNGDQLYGYTSLLYAWLEVGANELQTAAAQIANMPAQMCALTGSGVWLDIIGAYYKVPRFSGELDTVYGPRIPVYAMMPRGNNVAIEIAIYEAFGFMATVTDFVLYGGLEYNGAHTHNNTIDYNSSTAPQYGLFVVTCAYSGSDPTDFENSIKALVETVRDAGTHLYAVQLITSTTDSLLMEDNFSFLLLENGGFILLES